MLLAGLFVATALAGDLGADVRIRHELLENVPGLPNGGVLLPRERDGFTDHIRHRFRVWGEVKLDTEDAGHYRLFARLMDEIRWCVEPYKPGYVFPDEVVLDNLFLEGKDLFDGFLDFSIGRQDIYNLYGLDHIFVDGTPGDGSRSIYGDMVRTTLRFTEVSKLDLFAIYDFDETVVRWGNERSKHRSLTGFGGGAEPEMDDWGFGAVWGSELAKWLPYQLFVMQKNYDRFYRNDVKHPRVQRELFGFKLVPQLDEEWSLQLEGMSQVGANGQGDMLTGWSSYAGVNWKSSTASSIKPYGRVGYHFMSGADDAADEDGGHSAWDPMWARGVNDSELMIYGSLYGAAWWSNMHFLKGTFGLDFGPRHGVYWATGPMFAAAQDGMGGGNGMFKGYLNQVRYDFPLWLADKSKGERFEFFGHLEVEFINPGDYYASDKPAWFFRWQLDVRF